MKLQGATVLIVDDEAGLLEILSGWFEREGCTVLTAANGALALELAAHHSIDVLISDIRMPVMDGIQLAKRIKQSGKYIAKIIFISGFTDIDERESFGLGIEAKLSKPIRRLDLVSVVRRCLLDRGELWCEPPSSDAETTLEAAFASVKAALEQDQIAFGHGGICIRSLSTAQAGETIRLSVEFTADSQTLAGQGIVRWTAQPEEQIGIEITFIDDENRAWAVDLAERHNSMSFIPRTSRT